MKKWRADDEEQWQLLGCNWQSTHRSLLSLALSTRVRQNNMQFLAFSSLGKSAKIDPKNGRPRRPPELSVSSKVVSLRDSCAPKLHPALERRQIFPNGTTSVQRGRSFALFLALFCSQSIQVLAACATLAKSSQLVARRRHHHPVQLTFGAVGRQRRLSFARNDATRASFFRLASEETQSARVDCVRSLARSLAGQLSLASRGGVDKCQHF